MDLEKIISGAENRLNRRFDSVEEKLDELSDVKTRVALLEQTTQSITKALWGLFLAFSAAFFSYIGGLFNK